MSGFFDEPKAPTPMSTPYFSVTCETEGVNYKYSLDNSEPSQVSVDLNESGHFQLISGSPTTIRIRAYKEGYEPSDIATCTYTPVTVPMALPDGSVLFYDRGTSYGEYCIGDDGYPVRLSSGEDDGSVESTNWRYLICDKSDLEGKKPWRAYGTSEGITALGIGAGLENTAHMTGKYGSDNTYFWYDIIVKDMESGLMWFMPSKDELDILYDNRTIVTEQGGDAFQSNSAYWSSSEVNEDNAWTQYFSNGVQADDNGKYASYHCRLLRRI